ncbi:MAG: triose-phosphate isomerase [Betaproteobacteria bacterium]|jgi:triosephosphate isomerase
MRGELIIGNWKLNGNLEFNELFMMNLNRGLKGWTNDNRKIVICPPAIYLHQCNSLLTDAHILLGGQDLSTEVSGAYTGEISGQMLKDFGCRYVLVGHSERRLHHFESNQVVAQKTLAAIQAGLTPVVCIGETQAQQSEGQTVEVLKEQLSDIFQVLSHEDCLKIVIAYEPIWAIGTGITATPEQVQNTHAKIREEISLLHPTLSMQVKILYGGSVRVSNARELISLADVDGLLVGGTSLVVEDFLQICQIS